MNDELQRIVTRINEIRSLYNVTDKEMEQVKVVALILTSTTPFKAAQMARIHTILAAVNEALAEEMK